MTGQTRRARCHRPAYGSSTTKGAARPLFFFPRSYGFDCIVEVRPFRPAATTTSILPATPVAIAETARRRARGPAAIATAATRRCPAAIGFTRLVEPRPRQRLVAIATATFAPAVSFPATMSVTRGMAVTRAVMIAATVLAVTRPLAAAPAGAVQRIVPAARPFA